MQLRYVHTVVAATLFSVIPVQAQIPNVVEWSGKVNVKSAAYPGEHSSIEVEAVIQDGWHVYALTQVAGGPTPLRISVGDNRLVELDGTITGSTPSKQHDTSFDLETQTYSHSFTVTLPLKVKQDAPAGDARVPVSIRFQACSDRTCLPPRTVQVSVPLQVSTTK